MALSSILLAALSFGLAVDASLASRHAALKERVSKLDGSQLAKRQETQQQPSFPVPNAYLNNKTKPYWVDGAALPEVHFNIGESYAGLLPIDHSKELYFWFVPTTNPAAKDEITIW